MLCQSSVTARICEHCGVLLSGRPSELKRKRFCSTNCHYAHVRPVAEKFWSHVDKSGDCWLWLGGLNQRGYGRFTEWIDRRAKAHPAHRFAYELTFGPVSHDLVVCHDCDIKCAPGDFTYRRCVRPDHLFVGTQLENVADAMAKGRHHAGNPRLTENQVREIKSRKPDGEKDFQAIGEEFGVASITVRFIHIGRTWRHVK